MEEKAYIKNTFRYDSNNEMLSTVRHEALYACYILTENIFPDFETWSNKTAIVINTLEELPEDFDRWNDNLRQPVWFNDNYYTYGICLLNKWLTFDNIYINKTIDKNQSNHISELLYTFNPELFYDNLTEFSKQLFFFISSTNHNPTINMDELVSVVDDENEQLFKNLPFHNPYLGYYLNEGLIDRCIDGMDKSSNLYRLYASGSRMSKQQLSRTCINIGYVADANNVVIPSPICTHLMKGLNQEDYFRSGPGGYCPFIW